jgi:K+-sensing histidine kinase KdpD
VIYSPADLVTVLVLFLVALVTSQLAGSMRGQACLAAAHAQSQRHDRRFRARDCFRARASRTLPVWRCTNWRGCSAATRCW